MTTVAARTWSRVPPYLTEKIPLALFATMPPIVATSALPPGDGGKKRPCGRSSRLREASWAAAARSAGRRETRSGRSCSSAASIASSPAVMPTAYGVVSARAAAGDPGALPRARGSSARAGGDTRRDRATRRRRPRTDTGNASCHLPLPRLGLSPQRGHLLRQTARAHAELHQPAPDQDERHRRHDERDPHPRIDEPGAALVPRDHGGMHASEGANRDPADRGGEHAAEAEHRRGAPDPPAPAPRTP